MTLRFAVAAAFVAGCEVPAGSVAALDGRCQTCHPDQAAALAAGRMAGAATSTLFLALRDEATRELGGAAALACDRCHAPDVGDEGGLSCATCHAAVGHQGPSDGRLIHDELGPVRGPTGVVDTRAPHAVAEPGFSADSALCGTCHDVTGPAGFVESPYAHWTDGDAGAAGVGCVDCHMGPVPGDDRAEHPPNLGPAASLPDLPARPLADHRFVGLNGDPDAAVALLRRAVALDVTRVGGDVVATVHNRSTGHDLPDGASFLRELWVSVEDDAGPRAPVWLSTRLTRDGVEVPSPVLADAQLRGAIGPGDAREIVAADVIGATRVCVRFRAVRPDLLAHLGLDASLAGPVFDIVCEEPA